MKAKNNFTDCLIEYPTRSILFIKLLLASRGKFSLTN